MDDKQKGQAIQKEIDELKANIVKVGARLKAALVLRDAQKKDYMDSKKNNDLNGMNTTSMTIKIAEKDIAGLGAFLKNAKERVAKLEAEKAAAGK